MDDKTLFAIALLFLLIAVMIKTMESPTESIDLSTISVPVFADNYEVKTTIVNGETATIYYTSYSPTRGTYMIITVYKSYAVTTKTVYWYSDNTWYYITGAILETATSFKPAGIMTINMYLDNNVLVLSSNGTKYKPTGTLMNTISVFTIIISNTTIEYTLHHARYVPLK